MQSIAHQHKVRTALDFLTQIPYENFRSQAGVLGDDVVAEAALLQDPEFLACALMLVDVQVPGSALARRGGS